jgi:hypothetical protein
MCDMYKSSLRHIHDPVLSSLKMKGIRLFFCAFLCNVCFVSFSVMFVCICVLYYCHRVATQLQLNISYHIIILYIIITYVDVSVPCNASP